jgi:hypothetical protein
MEFTDNELIERYTYYNKLASKTDTLIGNRFIPRVKRYLKAGKVDKAREAIKKMPDCVSKVFAMDAFRQLTGQPFLGTIGNS